MTRPQPIKRLPKPCRHAATAASVVVCLVLGSATGSDAQDVDGRAILSWQSTDTGPQTAAGFHQQYDLTLLERLTDLIRLRLSFRAENVRNNVQLGDESNTSRFTQLYPSGELNIAYPLLQLEALYDLIRTTFGGVDAANRQLDRELVRMNWQPDFLPDVGIEAERIAVSDVAQTLDMTDKRLQATLSQTIGPAQIAAIGRTISLEDTAQGTLRDTREAQLNASFDKSFAHGRLTTSAVVNLLASRIEDSAGPRGGQIAQPVRIATAGTSFDDTPLDARDRPPNPAPALINGMTSPPGIPLGPTGQSFLNVTMDLGRFIAVDEFRMVVRDPSGNVVPTGGAVDWTVYVSTNQLDWIPVQGGSTTEFDAARSLYSVTFNKVETRLIKVVSFATNVVDTDLVEVLAFEHIDAAPGTVSLSDQRVGSVNAAVGGQPVDWATLSWNGTFNTSNLTREGRPDQRTDDFDQLASALIQPVDWGEVVLTYQWRGVNQSDGFDQSFNQLTADLHFKPRPGLNATLQALHGTDDSLGRKRRTDAVTLTGASRMWRALDLALDVGVQNQDLTDTDLTLDSRHLNGAAMLQLTRGWRLTAQAGVTQNDFAGAGPEGVDLGAADEKRWSLESDWRPSSLLNITGRIGRVTAGDFSAGVGSVRLQLSPFQGGALHFDSIYALDVDTAGQRTAHRLLLSGNWQLNPITSVNVSYNALRVDGATSQDTDALFASLELHL